MTSILKADTIQDTDGNNIINENSNTITIGASGDTTNIIGTLNKDGVAVTNTPAFEAFLSADQTGIVDVTETKVQVNTESFDTDNCYDNSTNYRFTPTVAGKYYVYGRVTIDEAAGNTRNALAFIYKNGSEKARSFVNFHSSLASDGEGAAVFVSSVIDFNGSSDYVELYGNHDTVNGGTGKFQGNGSIKYTLFGAYKLIT